MFGLFVARDVVRLVADALAALSAPRALGEVQQLFDG